MKHAVHTTRARESGSALIAVLCLVFVAGLLVAAVLAMSKYSSFTLAAHLALQKSMYVNEGAAARIQFLLAADRSLYPVAQPGRTAYSDYETDRFFADGVVHVMDYYGTPVEFTITDARSGFALGSNSYARVLNTISSSDPLNTALADTITTLSAGITDYVDSEDSVTTGGYEDADYEALGMSPLPRNGAVQFREELAWIPGLTAMFPTDKGGRLSSVRLVPPSGLRIPGGNPSLFTADRLTLKTYCPDLEDAELDQVLEALDVYKRERVLLSDQLDVLLLPRLDGLSWEESGVYTVTVGPRTTVLPDAVIAADAGEGAVSAREMPSARHPSGRLTFTWTGFNSTGPRDDTIQYLEWMFH